MCYPTFVVVLESEGFSGQSEDRHDLLEKIIWVLAFPKVGLLLLLHTVANKKGFWGIVDLHPRIPSLDQYKFICK